MTLVNNEKNKLEDDMKVLQQELAIYQQKVAKHDEVIATYQKDTDKYRQDIDQYQQKLDEMNLASSNNHEFSDSYSKQMATILAHYNITSSTDLNDVLSKYSLIQNNEVINSDNNKVEEIYKESAPLLDISKMPRPSALTTLTECQDTYVKLLKEYSRNQENLKSAHENIASTMVKMKLAKNEQTSAVLALEHCQLEAEVDATNSNDSIKQLKQKELKLQEELEVLRAENKKLIASLEGAITANTEVQGTPKAVTTKVETTKEKTNKVDANTNSNDSIATPIVDDTITEKNKVEINAESSEKIIKSSQNINDIAAKAVVFFQWFLHSVHTGILSLRKYWSGTMVPYYQNVILPNIIEWYQETFHPWFMVNINPWYIENLDNYVNQVINFLSNFYLKYLQDILFDYIIPVLDFLWMKLNLVFYYMYSYYDDENSYRNLQIIAYSIVMKVITWTTILATKYLEFNGVAIDYFKQQSFLKNMFGAYLDIVAPYAIYGIQSILAYFFKNYILGIGAFIILITFSPLWIILFILSKILNLIFFPFKFMRKLFKKKTKKVKDTKKKNTKEKVLGPPTQVYQQPAQVSANVYEKLKGQDMPPQQQQHSSSGPFSNNKQPTIKSLSDIDTHGISQIPLYPNDAMNIIRDSIKRDQIDDDV